MGQMDVFKNYLYLIRPCGRDKPLGQLPQKKKKKKEKNVNKNIQWTWFSNL